MKKRILFLGRFPMPIHGAAKMNELYFNSQVLNNHFELDRIKIGEISGIEKIGRFGIGKLINNVRTFFKIIAKTITFKPDIVYFEIAASGTAFLRDSIYVLLCRFFGKKVIFHLHSRGIREKIKNNLWRAYYRYIFKNSKTILLSELLYDEIENVVPKNNIYILPNGIEDELEDSDFDRILSERKKNKKPVLLFLSNMVESKGALDVLKICNELDLKKIEFEGIFAGPWQEPGFKEKWESLRRALELEDKCIYAGAKYGLERKELFSKADFFIFPTAYKNESFPLVILEAFMYGIPVFAYDNGAIREIIRENYLGETAEKGKWKYLADKIKIYINKKTNSKKIRKLFRNRHTIKTAEERLKNILARETND